MQSKQPLLYFSLALFFLTSLLIFRPINCPTEEIQVKIHGTISAVHFNVQTQDILISIFGDETQYRVNRGMALNRLKENLDATVGKPIVLFSTNRWTPLDPFGSQKNISQILQDEKLLYKEITFSPI